MKLGLIGPGRHGIRYAESCDDVEALLSRSGVTGSRKLESHWRQPHHYTEPDAFYAECFDGVIVATPPQSHKAHCLTAIARHIPVLVEKPLALTWTDCKEIIDAAETNGVPLLVAHLHLFDPEYQAKFGRESQSPVTIHSIAGGPTDHSDRGTFGDWTYSVLQDWAPHDVAMAIAANRYRLPDEWHVTESGEQAWIQMRWDTRRSSSVVGRFAEKVRSFISTDGRAFPTADGVNRNTIGAIVNVFKGLIRGEVDPRASYAFTRAIYRVLYTQCVDTRDAADRLLEAIEADGLKTQPMEN